MAEPLLALIHDVERLIAAGPGAAAGNERYTEHLRQARQLARQVPALTLVAELLERLVHGSADDAPTALLELLVLIRRLRPALATTGMEGRLIRTPKSGPWATAADAGTLRVVLDAARRTGSTRRPARQPSPVPDLPVPADLRLLDALLAILADGPDELADHIAEETLPAFGPPVLPLLGKPGRREGNLAEARRIMALCKLDPAAGQAALLDLAGRTGVDLFFDYSVSL